MKAPPWPAPGSVLALCMTLSMWESNIIRFDRDVADGINRKIQAYLADGRTVDAYEWRRADGSIATVEVVAVDVWRKRVARLVSEAEKRMEAKDWEWFFWVDEYAGMKSETTDENWREEYTTVIETGAKARKQRQAATQKAAEARRKQGNRTRENAEKTGSTARTSRKKKISDRHLRRIVKKKK